jgi:hypothetical protein
MEDVIKNSSLTEVGEAIELELGCKMVKDFSDNFPNETKSYFIGTKIIKAILSQPNCVGIRFYNAINEFGEKTLVYVGIDENDKIISEFTLINSFGELVKEKGIVADRVRTTPPLDDSTTDSGWW